MLCNQCGTEKKLLFTSWYCERCEGTDTNHTYEWKSGGTVTLTSPTHTCDFSTSFTCPTCGIDIGEFWKQLGPSITHYRNMGSTTKRGYNINLFHHKYYNDKWHLYTLSLDGDLLENQTTYIKLCDCEH